MIECAAKFYYETNITTSEEVMDTYYGFELVSDDMIDELKTKALLYRHIKTGAEVLSLCNNDENKVFCIIFRTPPTDSSGVPHILEHSVLCGSRKYPVKEPFVEILKGSLQTFLNAFTYPDKTCYPVASQNVQDFYNLIDVYLDAVFYPNITPFVFQQEGWHYELNDLHDQLHYKGVVFNEMKGAYSSPQRLIAEYSQQSLFPDTPYGVDSGGDPESIPSLDYERFRMFHKTYYHPSNARIFFYGDDDPGERLRIIDRYLADFDEMDVASAIPLQRRHRHPRRIERAYAVGADEAERSKGMVTVNWLLPETTDARINMALQVLGHTLIGMPGSPLRKALIDSGLGEDITGAGLENELRQMFFSVGLKGVDVGNADAVETLILNTLSRLVRVGIDSETIEASLNTMEFRLRENNTGSYPRGLIVMLRSLTTWLYDGDPTILLKFESLLSWVTSSYKNNTTYFEDLIDTYFLKNQHRSTVVLKPDAQLREHLEKNEKETLERIQKTMDDRQLRSILENTKHMRERQETPDSPESLATIPVLKLSDLERTNKEIPCSLLDNQDVKVLYHDLDTSGILYLDVGFDLRLLPQRYLPYVPLFGRALLQIGTKKEDYVELSKRISRQTGGIRSASFTSVVKDSSGTAAWLFLRGKTMITRTDQLLAVLKDVLICPELDNRERFRQMVLEEKARQENALIPGGHQIVNIRLRSHFTESGWLTEKLSGISYLFFIRKLTEKVESNWSAIHADLEDMLRLLINRKAMIVNVTVDGDAWSRMEPQLYRFFDELPTATPHIVRWTPDECEKYEGLTIPAQVNYVGKGAGLYSMGYQHHGSSKVIARYLRNSWLWDRVRVQGGAYGAFCIFNSLSGVLTMVSYRDPNLVKTITAFDEAVEFLRTMNLSRAELTKGIIGAIGDMDSYMLPDEKGYTSMLWYLNGNDAESRQQMRNEILSTTPHDFTAFADVLDMVRRQGIIKALGSESAIGEAVTDHGLPLKVIRVL